MPQCQAFGCSNKRGDLKENGERISCFAIPDPKKDPSLCSKWLHAIGTDKFIPSQYVYSQDRVVCEQHFTSDCFEEDMMAKLMGTAPKRKRLKPDSVPTIFSFRAQPKGRPNTVKRLQDKERQEMLQSLVKRPKKGLKTKSSAPPDFAEVAEREIPVSAYEVATIEVPVAECHGGHTAVRKVLRKSTCFVRDAESQTDCNVASSSCQTVQYSTKAACPEHDYIGFIPTMPAHLQKEGDQRHVFTPPHPVVRTGSSAIMSPEVVTPVNIGEDLGTCSTDTPCRSPPKVQRAAKLDLPPVFKSSLPSNTMLVDLLPQSSTFTSPAVSSSPSLSGRESEPMSSSSPSDVSLFTPSEVEDSEDEDDDDSSSDSEVFEEKVVREKKFVVFESSLKELIKQIKCEICQLPAMQSHRSFKGSMAIVQISCLHGHDITKWYSQPLIKNTPAGNIFLAAGVLFSGSSFSQMEQCFNFIGAKFISKSTFYKILQKTLIPVVNHTYIESQRNLASKLQGTSVWLSGDGRNDSPGYSAKYCSYTFMNPATEEIVDTELVQVTDATSSVAMEKVGFKRCLDRIRDNGITVDLVATDRHMGIRKMMREEYSDIKHNFDVWHFAKSIKKKLLAKAKTKDTEELARWIQAISNHLWWCCQNCGGDAKMLREMWTSILKHIVNVHSWSDCEVFHACSHPPLSDEERRLKLWLKPGSPAHEALQDVVLNTTVLRDLEQLVHACHTGALEVFHSVLLKYCPKRLEFTYPHMQARMHLAVLDHNNNVNRSQAVVKKASRKSGPVGDHRFNLVYSKGRGGWVVKKVYEQKSFSYVQSMMVSTVKAVEGSITLESIENQPRPSNIARVGRPDKATMIQKLKSRFAKKSEEHHDDS